MAVKVTLEFDTVEATIVALGRLLSGKPGRAARSTAGAQAQGDTGPQAQATNPSEQPDAPATTTAGDSARVDAVVDASPAPNTPATRTRKPRADAGKPRGPHKNAATAESKDEAPGTTAAPAVAAPEAVVLTEEQRKAIADAESYSADNAARQALQDKRDAAVQATKEDAQAALEKLFNDPKHGILACQTVLREFGAERARELKPEDRAGFIKRVGEVLAGAA